MATRSHGCGQGDKDVERIHGVAAKAHRFAVGCFYVTDDQVGMQLDAQIGGDFRGSKLDFGDVADGLARGVERGGDVVVLGEKTDRPGRLGPERSSATDEGREEQEGKLGWNFSTDRHPIPFSGHLSQRCEPTPFYVYRIADTGLSVATAG